MENLVKALEYLQANQFVASLVALPISAGLNILLGVTIANFKSEFDKSQLLLGVKKGLVVYISIAVLSGLAQFVTFADLDLINTMAIMVYGVMATYVVQSVEKIAIIINYKKSEIE